MPGGGGGGWMGIPDGNSLNVRTGTAQYVSEYTSLATMLVPALTYEVKKSNCSPLLTGLKSEQQEKSSLNF